jgi:MFS transporter, DHA1 family, chloramphenicol/florfenicol resistance protein
MPNTDAHRWAHSLPSALWLMAPFDLLASLAMDLYLPVVPEMIVALDGASPALVQLTLSVYMVTLGLGQVLFGPLSDRLGRRPVLLGGATLFTIASAALAATSDGVLFLSLRIAQGVGASAALVATFATVRDVYADRPEGATIYGLFGSMLAFVPALGPLLGALLAGAFGWRAIFLTLGLLGCGATVRAVRGWHETLPDRPTTVRGPRMRFVVRSSAFWTYTLGFSAAMGAFFVFFSTAPRVLIGRAGLSQLAFSVAFASVAVVMIVTTRFTGRFVSRWGVEGSLVRGLGVIVLGGLVLLACSLAAAPSVASFVGPMWLVAAGIALVVSVAANGALQEFGDMAGTAVALFYCMQSLIVGTLGTALVVLLRGDSAWPLTAYCLTSVVVTAAALGWHRRGAGAPAVRPSTRG